MRSQLEWTENDFKEYNIFDDSKVKSVNDLSLWDKFIPLDLDKLSDYISL